MFIFQTGCLLMVTQDWVDLEHSNLYNNAKQSQKLVKGGKFIR